MFSFLNIRMVVTLTRLLKTEGCFTSSVLQWRMRYKFRPCQICSCSWW